MDYLDELNVAAIQALAEMGFSLATTTTANVAACATETPQRRVLCRPKIEASYLLRLEHPFPTSRDVANNLMLPRVPRIEIGDGEDGATYFCHLDEAGVEALDIWTASNFPTKRWVKVRLGMAHKGEALHLLGRDATLPQNRPARPDLLDRPYYISGKKFPTQYFVYGTLACTTRLSRLFEVAASEVPALKPAVLHDGRIRMWAKRYRALVDSPGEKVQGFACVIRSDEEEDALRRYEGDNYEVVAARFVVCGTEVRGRTFRFVGRENELSI